ncbi:MAG: class I SAM-dependent methyltransferase [Pseudomonadota bacterium]
MTRTPGFPATPDENLPAYYARRANEYERIYAKPERQADLAQLRFDVPALLKDELVLELACGTGYWTPLIAAQAARVLAIDINEEVLQIARSKAYPRGNVRFERGDAYDPPRHAEPASACFAGFWWSHLPQSRVREFLDGLARALRPGARVVLLDNAYVEGSSTPISRTDAEGNSYQRRSLANGESHEVLKNFPQAGQFHALLPEGVHEWRWQAYPYYWLASWRLPA